ncbi:MAG: hypothetical protein QXH10_06465 [Ignisphaera sp.]|uniref:Uncharacterized protein n=1 Tax=Ignisphaera aggregans TaxID=334771 RepID=A0A7C4NM16_9CREN
MVALEVRRKLIVLVALASLLGFLLNPIFHVEASGELLWSRQSNLSILDDKPFAICLIEDYIYVIGYDRNMINAQFRIEKRYKYDGSLVKVWNRNPSSTLDDILYDCTVVNNMLYVVGVVNMFSTYGGFESGKLFIAILDKELNLLKTAEGPDATYGISIESDGSYIYIGGVQRTGIHYMWYLEKRDLNLNLVDNKVYSFDRYDNSDYLYSISFNPVTGRLWAVGSIDAVWWGVVILDKNLSILRIVKSDLGGTATSITFDDAGNAFVVGIGVRSDKSVIGIVKYNSSGSEVKRILSYYGSKTLYVNGDIYVFYANPSKHVIYIYDRELILRKTATLNNNTGCSSSDSMGRVSTDGITIYFATNVCYKGIFENTEWVIYAFTPIIQRMYFTVTLTLTKTTTVQIPTTITSTRLSTVYTTATSTKTLTTTLTAPVTTTVHLPTTLTTIVTITSYTATPMISTYPITSTVTETISTTITLSSTHTLVSATPIIITSYEKQRTLYSVTTSYIVQQQTVTHTITTTIVIENTQNKEIVAASRGTNDYHTIAVTIASLLVAGVLLFVFLGSYRQR